TVLVKGQVTLINQRGLLKDKMIVRPGEKVLFNKETGDFSAEKVNTEQYTSWIHGYMVLDKRSVSYVFRSLERYYDTEIKYKDITDDVTFSGKLDLKENIADVLSIIGFASSLDIINEAGVYCVQKQ
ncbi:MAG: DUF4974 domain-containing protein, partial [Prolixibacteraceae bacterium]|nr:DUF4974 domain-containing protein [Prolixibacteraceae bacterium]